MISSKNHRFFAVATLSVALLAGCSNATPESTPPTTSGPASPNETPSEPQRTIEPVSEIPGTVKYADYGLTLLHPAEYVMTGMQVTDERVDLLLKTSEKGEPILGNYNLLYGFDVDDEGFDSSTKFTEDGYHDRGATNVTREEVAWDGWERATLIEGRNTDGSEFRSVTLLDANRRAIFHLTAIENPGELDESEAWQIARTAQPDPSTAHTKKAK